MTAGLRGAACWKSNRSCGMWEDASILRAFRRNWSVHNSLKIWKYEKSSKQVQNENMELQKELKKITKSTPNLFNNKKELGCEIP